MLCSELFVSFSFVYFVISPQFKPFWDFTISRTNLASIEKSAAGKVGLTLPRYQSPQWPSQKHENTGKLETIWLQYQRHPSNFIWQYLICQAQWRVSQHHSPKKHSPDDLKLPRDADTSPICFSTAHIRAAISSIPQDSGAGPDGLWPQHLKECISITAGVASTSHQLNGISQLPNKWSSANWPQAFPLWRPTAWALQKQRRPQTHCCRMHFRRLVTKVCLRPFIPRLRELLLPSQIGVGTPLGCEAAVHTTHYFMDHGLTSQWQSSPQAWC